MIQFFNTKSALITTLAIAAFAVTPASAAVITYNFTIDHCTGLCGPGLSAQVKITDIVAGTVQVDVSGSGFQFVNSTSGGDNFLFNLSGNPAVTFSAFTSGWRANQGDTLTTQSAGSKGGGGWTFEYSVTCHFTGGACPGGGSSTATNPPLTFTVTAAGLTTASFNEAGGGTTAIFAADVLGTGNTKGNTGLIGFTRVSNDTSVPEPASFALVGAGLSLIGLLRKRQ